MPADDGHATIASGHHHFSDFQRFGEFEPIVAINCEASGLAARHQLLEIARLILEKFDQVLVDRMGGCVIPVFGPEQMDQLIRAMRGGTHQQRDEEAVDEHPLAVDPVEIGGIEIAGECRSEMAARILFDPRSDQMRPDRQAIVVKVAEHAVQFGVPVIEVAHIGGLE